MTKSGIRCHTGWRTGWSLSDYSGMPGVLSDVPTVTNTSLRGLIDSMFNITIKIENMAHSLILVQRESLGI